MKVLDLRELLWERGLVERRWMLTYIKKAEVVEILTKGVPPPEPYIALLRQRQKTHMTKATSARRDRAARFGVATLTPAEKIQRILHENPILEYVGTRVFPDGFESASGYRRGTRAIVVRTPDGAELLLTKGEAEMLRDLGIGIPHSAFSATKKVARPTTARTMKDMF